LSTSDFSLSNLLASPSLAPTKLDEIKVKFNILSAFVAQKAEEIKNDLFEESQQVVGKAKGEL
jgi:protein disulfide-isomerase A6